VIYMLTVNTLINVLGRLEKMLRQEYGEASLKEIRERKGRFQVYIGVRNRYLGSLTVKILISKDCSRIRVYTGRTGLDLRIKRFLLRELPCIQGDTRNEATT